MRKILLLFIFTLTFILISAIFHLEIYALLVVIAVALIKLTLELFSVNIAKLKYIGVAVTVFVLVSILYGLIYFLLPPGSITPSFDKSLIGISNAVYFSFVTITTLGYGDFAPVSLMARAVVVSQLIAGIVILSISINYIIGKDEKGGRRPA